SPQNPETHRFCQGCGWRLRLGDRYEAVHPVGAGQNSRTFLGRDRTTVIKPQCLIKRFTPVGNTRLEQEAAAERLRKDVVHLEIASQHPQIPNLLSYFERASHQFLVQDFLVGTHLEQHLQDKRGPFSSQEVLSFLQDVLPILQHLHQHHIIHRDIKPTNLRRPADQSHWWLVDLGVIKPVTATRMANPATVVGSAEYVAPEQLRGEATFASDLYSLGTVCLHLLTGLPPFDLFDSVNGCWQWRSIVPDVDAQLATVLDGMVQPGLSDRLSSVEAVLTALAIPLPIAPQHASAPTRRPQHWLANWELHLENEIRQIAALPAADILLILTAAGTIEVRSLHAPQNLLNTLTPSTPQPLTLAPHPQQPTFVLGTRQGTLERWHLAQGAWRCHRLPSASHGLTQLLFTPDGATIIGADAQGELHCWGGNGKHQATPRAHSTPITALALSHCGTLLASGDTQGQVTLWQLQLPAMDRLRIFNRHAGAITALCWLREDQALITAGWDMTVWWRHPETGGILQALKAQGFGLPIRALLAHPQQPDLITGSQDGLLQCWPSPSEHQSPGNPVTATTAAPSLPAPIVGLVLQPGIPALLCATQTGYLVQRSLPD
ncbi:MAG: protein kinase, partial [Cyanobacteria bacterium J06636_16]